MGSGLSEKMENIKLHGGQFYITDTKGMLYRVVKGHVLVYLVPVKTDIGDGTDTDRAGSFGKRMLLKEMTEGERIPAFCHESQLLGIWRFMFMALDQAELEKLIGDVQKKMKRAATELDFETAATLRDQMIELKKILNDLTEGK